MIAAYEKSQNSEIGTVDSKTVKRIITQLENEKKVKLVTVK